jgi:hypothetical protein
MSQIVVTEAVVDHLVATLTSGISFSQEQANDLLAKIFGWETKPFLDSLRAEAQAHSDETEKFLVGSSSEILRTLQASALDDRAYHDAFVALVERAAEKSVSHLYLESDGNGGTVNLKASPKVISTHWVPRTILQGLANAAIRLTNSADLAMIDKITSENAKAFLPPSVSTLRLQYLELGDGFNFYGSFFYHRHGLRTA